MPPPDTLWLGVHWPQAVLQAQAPDWASRAVVLFDKERAVAASPAALATGVQLGLRRGGVLALCPSAQCLPLDAQAQQQWRERLALPLLRYTPELQLAGQQTVLLHVTRSLVLFGGLRALRRLVRQTAEAEGLAVQLSVAPSAMAAWLLAVTPRGPRHVLRPSAVPARLARLPCTGLPQADAHLEWLQALGCHTLGDVLRLPRIGLRQRGAADLLEALDAAQGRGASVANWFVPPPQFCQTRELPERTTEWPRLQPVLGLLLSALTGWLAAQQQGVHHVELRLAQARGPQAAEPLCLPLSLRAPSADAAHLASLFAARLAQLALPEGVVALTLEALDTVPLLLSDQELFPLPQAAQLAWAPWCDQVQARLGPAALLQAQPRVDHRPGVANAWATPQPAGAASVNGVLPPSQWPRPGWLLAQPQPLSVQHDRPCVEHAALRLLHGPERIEDGWWDAATEARDYFIAQDDAGAKYWVFRTRAAAPQWFLQGVFG